MRTASIKRETRETKIALTLTLDSACGGLCGTSGIGFFDHMLNSFCVHGGFEMTLDMTGDLFVDAHHTVEDVGIVLGKLFSQILGERNGIARFGSAVVPMDESLAEAVIDIGGRAYLVYNVPQMTPALGQYDTQLTREFFFALSYNMGATLHIDLRRGENAHHMTEAVFKAAARAISAAAKTEEDGKILSAKGTLA